ncbi:MAG: TlpA disulfide reductase family protein [Haliscomenobacter sp.]|uniref:TlpA family protein disulfide reductase n=1 Tax=Haliscomenobacter sp. TaxID=2717303 RepID=UPI0029A7886E|nr:TlpA disulfide reductase family protein [Haliscomenobacter sp.]MDX2071281.1 TlpA disulfide reductase family protein [Haliscomenobacter sp.]
MKTISLFFLALFASSLFAQTNIQIVTRDLLPRKIDKVEFFDLSQKEFYTFPYQDTINVTFFKDHADCYNIRYHVGGKILSQQMWLDVANIVIKGHLDTQRLVIDTVINAPLYYEVLDFGKQIAALYKTKDTTRLNEFLLESVQKNIQNPFSLIAADHFVRANQNSKLNLLKLKPYLEKQGDQFSWFLFYRSLERIDKILAIQQPQLENYSCIDPKGKKGSLALTSADYTVLDMWFLACPPCVQQHQEIKEKLPLLKQHNIEMIGISTDLNQKKWQTYLRQHEYDWLNYREDGTQKLTKDLGIFGYPTYVILDKTGKIVGYYNDFQSVLKFLNLS